MNKTLDIFEDFQSTKNLDELWETFHCQLSQYGVSSVFYGITHSLKVVEDIGIISSGWYKTSHPEDYCKYFDDKFYIDDDLSSIHCITNTAPFIWHDQSQWGNPTERQKKFMLESFEFNMGVGVTVPLRFNQHGIGGLGFSCADVDGREFNKIWMSHENKIITIARIFDVFAREVCKEDFYHLSPREKEVLTLLSAGYTAKMIAGKLRNSASTVEKQVRSARKKLNARNNEQAVTKALILNLIAP